jgi:hypothetical protein
MKFRPSYALVLLLCCIALGGLAVFATDPLLYAVEKDTAVSVFHTNPEVLKQLATSSRTDMVPLMQDVLDNQEPVVIDIRLRDLDAAQRDLALSAARYGSLRNVIVRLEMNDGEVRSFLLSSKDQSDILAAMMNTSLTLDAVKTTLERGENTNDKDAQATVASQAEALKSSVRALYARYLQDHEIVANTSTKLGLDTASYLKTKEELRQFVAEIEALEVPAVDPASLQVTKITLLLVPNEATYRDTVQVFGVTTPAGQNKPVSLLLDGSRFETVQTDLFGNYLTSYTVERIRAGEHTFAAVTGSLAPAEQKLRVTKSGTITTLTAKSGHADTETGAICTGSVMANHPVRNAPLTIFFDGNSRLDTITDEDGMYQAFVPLSPGNHKFRAQFSSDDYPLFPSLSDEVTIKVLPAPVSFSLPETSSWDPIIVYGALVLVLLGVGSAAFWFIRRSKRAPLARAGPYKEPADAVRIREDLELIITEAEQEFPPAGSEREAALHTAISTLLGMYWACLMEQGLSEAARQAYLTLAGRIAARLHLPAFRTLTPREMSKTCSTENYAGIFDRFVGIYEKIRYGGSRSEQDRKGFEAELQKADTEVRSDSH